MNNRNDRRRRLAAIVSADVAGYSRLMGQDEDATITALNECRALFRHRIESHRGRVVDTAGDSVLAAFDSVVEAVQCASEVQTALVTRNEDLPDDRRMRFRIGVNLGDVVEQDDGTIYGDGVNVAARLQQLAEPGMICISESAHMQAVGKLDLVFEDIGAHTVKNIARPVRAFRVGAIDKAQQPAAAPRPALPDKPSIAVLPFDNMSGDPEQDYFADGLSEDIITALSHFRELFVIARNTTSAYKGTNPNIQELGASLGVRYVLEGSVRRAGNRLRLNAQLIDAQDGGHVWAQKYDREMSDIFEVQDELTANIVSALGVALSAEALTRARAKAPDQLNAYDLVLRAMEIYKGVSPERHAECRAWAEQAVALAPDYARAHAMLSLAYLDEHRWKLNPVPDRPNPLRDARAEARRAVELDPSDALSHYALAKILFFERDFDLYAESFERAIRLNENFADAKADYAIRLGIRGEVARAGALVDEAKRLNPNTPRWYYFADSAIAMHENDYQQVISALAKVAMPDLWPVHQATAVANAYLGRGTEARAALAELLRCLPEFADDPRDRLRGLGYTDEDVERRIEGLRRAGLKIPEQSEPAD